MNDAPHYSERDYVPAIIDLLDEVGFPLILSGNGTRGISKSGEFGILTFPSNTRRRPDVVAVRWNPNGQLYSIAVECKTTPRAVLDALGQAVEYQGVFDEVYIGTPLDLEHEGIMRSALVDLGVGHIRIPDPGAGPAEVTISPAARSTARLQPPRKRHVDSCLALGLAFGTVTGSAALLEGGTGSAQGTVGMWYAEDVGDRLQWNCWYFADANGKVDSGSGINVEFRSSIAHIVARVESNPEPFEAVLRALPDDYIVDVRWIPNHMPKDVKTDCLPRTARRATFVGIADRIRNDRKAGGYS